MSRKAHPHMEPYLFVLNLMSEMRSCGAAMLASRCLIDTYVIQVSLYMPSAEETGTQFSGQQPVLNAQASSSDPPRSL